MEPKYRAIQGETIQQEVYMAIVDYFKTHGYCPTHGEVGEKLMLSETTVGRHVKILTTMGLLKTEHPGQPRAYTIAKFKFVRK